jgi:hypothetical protein
LIGAPRPTARAAHRREGEERADRLRAARDARRVAEHVPAREERSSRVDGAGDVRASRRDRCRRGAALEVATETRGPHAQPPSQSAADEAAWESESRPRRAPRSAAARPAPRIMTALEPLEATPRTFSATSSGLMIEQAPARDPKLGTFSCSGRQNGVKLRTLARTEREAAPRVDGLAGGADLRRRDGVLDAVDVKGGLDRGRSGEPDGGGAEGRGRSEEGKCAHDCLGLRGVPACGRALCATCKR